MALAAECSVYGGDADFRDVFGFCCANEFKAYCQLDVVDRSLATMTLDYTRSLLDTLDFIRAGELADGKKPPIADTLAHLHSLTAQTGVHAFPALVAGNDQAQLPIVAECAVWLHLEDELAELDAADRARVEQLFADICVLDAQIHDSQPITAHHQPGFALDRVRCCVPLLHAGTGTPLF